MKKKHVVIGDLHGRTVWQRIVSEHPDAIVVFMGDYCDPYPDEGISQEQVVSNLEAVVQLKIEQPRRVVLLTGNHDLPYLVDNVPCCTRHDPFADSVLKPIFRSHAALFQMAYEYSTLLFTHAGVVSDWFYECFGGDPRQGIAAQFNDPAAYGLKVETLYAVGRLRGGAAPSGGILWADLRELEKPLERRVQVVGHNRVKRITTLPFSRHSGIVYSDALRYGEYLLIESAPFSHSFSVGHLWEPPVHLITYSIL